MQCGSGLARWPRGSKSPVYDGELEPDYEALRGFGTQLHRELSSVFPDNSRTEISIEPVTSGAVSCEYVQRSAIHSKIR